MNDLSKYSDEDIINIVSSDAEEELRRRGYVNGWHKKSVFAGAIYVLVNPAFPDLVKIGYADNVQKRIKTLNRNSGLPDPFHCYAVYKVRKRLEDLRLHNLIDTLDPSLRHSKNREFYEMDRQKAYDILSAIAQINGDEEQLSVNPFSDSYFDNSVGTGNVPAPAKNGTKKRKRLKFRDVGVPVGSVLVFVKDNSITCNTVDDANKVEYQGVVYPISRLAAQLLGISSAQGGLHFMYNGETLTEIRDRLGV